MTPYYNKPGQAGVLHHFRTVAEATGVPVMLYDVPGRTGTHDRPGDLRRGQARSTPSSRSRTRSATSPAASGSRELGYAVYSGDDVANLGWLAHGAAGFVSVVGHVAGDADRARWPTPSRPATTPRPSRSSPGCSPRSTPSWASPNYGATTAKAALQLLGVLDNRNVRGPLVPLDDDEVDALRAGLAASGLL